jgi:hypothetical protein
MLTISHQVENRQRAAIALTIRVELANLFSTSPRRFSTSKRSGTSRIVQKVGNQRIYLGSRSSEVENRHRKAGIRSSKV